MLRWSWVAARTDVPSRLIANPLLPASLMNVVNVPVAGGNRRMSEGWTFCGPAPSYMLDSNRVCVAASQVGPSRKLNPSAILVAVGFCEGSGLPKGPPGHGPSGAAAEASAMLEVDRARAATTTTIGPGFR